MKSADSRLCEGRVLTFWFSFYFEAAKILDRLDAKQGSIKGVLATLPEKDRKRTAALVIETLKCEEGLAGETRLELPSELRLSQTSLF